MNTKAIATVSAAALAMSAPVAALATQAVSTGPALQPVSQQAETSSATVLVSNVQGTFGFNQAALTANSQIKSVFQKAAASLCNVLPAYEAIAESFEIAIGGAVPNPFSASISQMAEASQPTMQIMTCSCTSNSVGGAAIATSEIEGVSIADIARIAGV